jgi:formate dehydrogenase subunit delta
MRRQEANMHVDALVRMANQIGQFFEAMPDRPEALEGVAVHLKKFWEPRMRRALLAHVDATAQDSGLNGMVCEAIRLHRSKLEP